MHKRVQRGQGTRDLSYFLCNSLSSELRRRHEREIISLYLLELRACGVRCVPDFEEAWLQHRWHSLYAWIGMAITAAAADLQTEERVRTAVARSATAVQDLDALALLRR